jgi:hypothetical protein
MNNTQIIYLMFCVASGLLAGSLTNVPKDIIINLSIALLADIVFYVILTK